jgi:hypothetical protein
MQQLIYPVALILSTTRKTCEQMASLGEKNGNKFFVLIKEKQVMPFNYFSCHIRLIYKRLRFGCWASIMPFMKITI